MNTRRSGETGRDRRTSGEEGGGRNEMDDTMNEHTNQQIAVPEDELGLEGELEAMAKRMRAEGGAVDAEPPADLEGALLVDLRHAMGSEEFGEGADGHAEWNDLEEDSEATVHAGPWQRWTRSAGLRAAAALIVLVGFSALLVRNGFFTQGTDRLRPEETLSEVEPSLRAESPGYSKARDEVASQPEAESSAAALRDDKSSGPGAAPASVVAERAGGATTVTSETPLLDERRLSSASQITRNELDEIQAARDPLVSGDPSPAPESEESWVGTEQEITFRGGSPRAESTQNVPSDRETAGRDGDELRSRLERLPRGLRNSAEELLTAPTTSEVQVADDSDEAETLKALGYVDSSDRTKPLQRERQSLEQRMRENARQIRERRKAPRAEPPVAVAEAEPALESDRIFAPERAREVPTYPRVHVDRFDAMTFRDYGISPFVDTERDAQSTFGLEVDTGSFNLARRYLDAGTLPPPEAIRVEEIVNALDYRDVAPRRDDFAISVEGTVSPFDGSKVLLRVGVKARELEERERPAAALTFLIDTSGSMNRENRLGLVQRSLEFLIDRLEPGDTVAIVTYGSRGRVELEPTGDRERIRYAVRSLRPSGSTNLEEGMRLAYELAGRRVGRRVVSRVILCSDGVANVGLTDAEALLRSVAEWGSRGVELTAVGVGLGNYNDEMLERLAGRGDGRYAYVDQLDEARRLFVEDLTGTLFTVGKDARVQVTFDADQVSRYRLIGYENRAIPDHRFRDRRTDGGEIGAGHAVSAVYELELRQAKTPGWFDRVRGESLGQVALVYRRVGEAGPESDLSEISATIRSSAVSSRFDRAPASLRLAAVAARFAEILRVSPYVEGDLGTLFEQAQALVPAFPGDRRVVQFVDMIGATRDRLLRD